MSRVVILRIAAAVRLAIALTCGGAAAAPPEWVYLATDRVPDAVFRNGFPAAGSADDVLAHVNAQTCVSGESAFVSTTAIEAFAHERALHILRTDPNALGYVYRIRADQNFYSAVASLSAERYQAAFPELLAAAQRTRDQQEWLAHRGVPAALVHSAQSYRRDSLTGRIQFHGERTNPNYVEAATRASNASYPIVAFANAPRFLVPSFSRAGVSACFSCIGPDQPNRARRAASAGAARCGAFPVAESGAPDSVIDPITGKLVERYVPWKHWTRSNGYATREAPEGCTILPGSSRLFDVLMIDCRRFAGTGQFHVHLGAGGSRYVWVDKWYSDGITSDFWIRGSTMIPVKATRYMLSDYSWSIYDVFSGVRSSWWASIRVVPVFPALARPLTDICLHKDSGFAEASACFRWNVEVPRLQPQIDNQTSTISAANGQRFQVCDGADFTGRCAILLGAADIFMLNRLGLNDRISSIRACLRPIPNLWLPPPDNRGLIGSIFAYDDPASDKREFFQLLRATYGPFPATGKPGNDDWIRMRGYDEC